MTLVAIFYHHSNNLPIVMELSAYEKFIECCETLPTDWAHLMNQETGEILHTWGKKMNDCWECKHLEKRRGGDQYCLLYGRPLYVDANKARCRDYQVITNPTKPAPIKQSINRLDR
jgi:hypothetical protein